MRSDATGARGFEATNRTTGPARGPKDRKHTLQLYLLLDLFVRLNIWGLAIALTTATFNALGVWPEGRLIGADWHTTLAWARRIGHWVILFNVTYVAELVVLRALIPTPKEGRYSTARPRMMDRNLLWSCLIGVLTKARYEAPFPGFLVFHIANLPPMCWLMGPIFGPKSRSCYLTEPRVLDPSLVEIGRNVIIGLGAIISGHVQLRDEVIIQRTRIEDEVVVGGNAIIFSGVHLRQGCMIGAGAVVLPGTVVGPGEFWAGVPARKIGMVANGEMAASS